MRLRQDEQALSAVCNAQKTNRVAELRSLEPAIRSRVLSEILLEAGVKEPEAAHIHAMEQLVFSDNPSAKAHFPGGVTVTRNYGVLEPLVKETQLQAQELSCPGECYLPGVKITCTPNDSLERTTASFAVTPKGKLVVRPRQTGDEIRLFGGTKRLKKLFIDQKIPTAQRDTVPVLADDGGVVGVVGFGGNLDRISPEGTVRIQIEYL